MEGKDLLKGFPIFSNFPQEQLSEITQWSKTSDYSLNEIIFRDGETAAFFYCVVDGEVELSLVFRDKILKTDIQYEESIQTHIENIQKEIIVDSIEPGETFGWSAMVEPRLFTTTARCSKTSNIISLPIDRLKAVFDKNPHLGYVFMERLAEIISQRLRDRTEKLIESWSQAFDVNNI